MSTPSTALDGITTRPAPAPALKIVPARHPLQVFGTVLALALILIGLQSVLGNPRWGWGTFAEWFFARPVLEGLGRTLLLTALGTGLGFALGTLLALARVSVHRCCRRCRGAMCGCSARSHCWCCCCC